MLARAEGLPATLAREQTLPQRQCGCSCFHWRDRYQSATLSGEAFRQMVVYDEDHNTVLHLAAQRGHLDMIVRVVNEGLSLEVRMLC